MAFNALDERVNRRDLDPHRRCARCGKPGLRYENKSGLCSECHLAMPGLLKAIGTVDLNAVIRRVVQGVVEHYGEFRASTVLGIDLRLVRVVLGGGSIVADVIRPDDELDYSRLDPDIARLMMRRYIELRPLEPGWAAVVEPWRVAMRRELDREDIVMRRKRVVAGDERADVDCFVPPTSAPFDHHVVPNAYGRYAPGSHRGDVPMRIAAALWVLGFGAIRIARIASDVGVQASASALGRVLKQAQRDYPGAELVSAADLAAEMRTRPLGHLR